MNKKAALCLSLMICFLLLAHPMSQAAVSSERVTINSWCLDIINMPEAIAHGDAQVKIALIDSGVSAVNKYIYRDKIMPGYNFVFNNSITNDLIGHGTRTAAIITGGSSEKKELIGIGSRASIVPLLWISKYPSGVLANGGVTALSKAIMEAVDVHKCKIINISSGIRKDEPELRKAVAYAEEKGVILISAVGNTNLYAPDEIYYPSAYETVVGVGSVNRDMKISEFSQRNKSVRVVAPGEKVWSVAAGSSKDFSEFSGTSYSAAYVSGFACLLLSQKPDLSPEAFREILITSSYDLGDKGYDTAYGYGLIDVAKGLQLIENQ